MNLPGLSELATGLGGAGIGSVVTGLFGHRKTKADTASILSSAAAVLVEPLEKRITKLTGELDTMRTEFLAHKRATDAREATRRMAMAAHTEWDTAMAGLLRGAGFDVPAPPPLDAA
ncbi:hypothetical protein ACFXG4_27095 [Nocardia sp. NPDC059246]|uniref:hypothetical protein n=1 Tax=unclassified Nocardia TaxID=2637762 RepID=UPI003698F798